MASLRTATRVLLVPLGSLAGALWAFAAFGSAFWANIHVDGVATATTTDVLAAVAPGVGLFLLPGLVVVGVARRLGLRGPSIAFGGTAAVAMTLLTLTYAVPALAVAALPWAPRMLPRRRTGPAAPIDVIAVTAGFLLVTFWCYAEAHR